MEAPDLSCIVETHVPVSADGLTGYFSQLRQDVLPHVRKLQADGHLRWFSFLIHPASQLAGYDPADGSLVIHLRLEPAAGLDLQAFMELLPAHFQEPRQVTLSEISGVNGSALRDNDWAHAWRIVGEASEWVLCLVEGHEREPSLQQVVQFLHFITNPLRLGHRCLCIPAGFLSF